MNDQLYTLLDVTRLPIGGWAKFLRTTAHGWLIVNGEGSTDSLQIVGKQELGRTSTKTSAPASQLRVIRTERGTPLPRKETVCRVSLRMAGNRNFRAQSRELTEFIIEEFLCGMTPERWKQIEELYHAAQARGRDVLAGVDSELRAKVEALLAQDSAGKILDDPAAELLPDSTLTMLMPGSQLGPYRIESKLGAGGMGEVVRATDTRLHRTVAIKTLQHDKHQDKRRFLQEARAASELNHPNIVVLYDIAKDNGTDYLVMEYVRGKSLDKLIPARGLALDEVIRYAEQIASALVAAHAAGIVHRDIKPTNIMVTETGQVKVLDFGLAKLDERVPDEETRSGTLTEAGVIMGTLAFMSPEQARGEKVDARTDLFSFGAVLYQMSTGQRAFSKPLDWTTPAADPLPRELRPILLKLLEVDRDLRYQHASDLRADFERLKRDAAARQVGIPKKWKLAAAGAAVLGLAIAGYFYLHRTPTLTEKDTIVLADFENRTGDPVFDGTLRQGLTVQLQQSPFLSLVSDDRIRQTLSLMGQPADAPLTPAVAGEICQRTTSAAVLEGSITSLGSQYVLGLRAKNCRTGEVLADEQSQVAKKEDVLVELGLIASKFRTRLGESLATVKLHDTPLAEATTSSLEALKA